jgi:ABC-type multidrug transport system fused ATPase/permease subunit
VLRAHATVRMHAFHANNVPPQPVLFTGSIAENIALGASMVCGLVLYVCTRVLCVRAHVRVVYACISIAHTLTPLPSQTLEQSRAFDRTCLPVTRDEIETAAKMANAHDVRVGVVRCV